MRISVWLAGFMLVSQGADAGMSEITFSGDIGMEPRFYLSDGQYPGQDHNETLSLFAEPEARWQSESGTQQFAFRPFGRWTEGGDDRSHADIRDLYWRWQSDGVEILAGMQTLFWGVTESRHLIDIINQQDIKEDIDREDKLGQPMMSLSRIASWGNLSYYFMPYFREIDFPDEDSRVLTRPPMPVDDAEYESPAAEHRIDQAIRYSHYLGDWDLGVYYFDGTSRDPVFRSSTDGQSLIPYYPTIDQVGVDVQYTSGAWLWKLEALRQKNDDYAFNAAVGGFEYTLFQFLGSSVDLGLLVEYLYDGRNDKAPQTLFDKDVFAGMRLFMNDTRDTSALLGTIYDPQTYETMTTFEGDMRLFRQWSVHAEMRLFTGASANEPQVSLEKDDYIEIAIIYGF